MHSAIKEVTIKVEVQQVVFRQQKMMNQVNFEQLLHNIRKYCSFPLKLTINLEKILLFHIPENPRSTNKLN